MKPGTDALRDGFLFQFNTLKNKFLTGGGYARDRDSYADGGKAKRREMLFACSGLSVCWIGLVSAYGFGLASAVYTGGLPAFVYFSLAIIALFPAALIWSGYFIYTHILQAQQTGNAVLEAARILGSPALLAAGDVQTLSSAINSELNVLKSGFRELEERLSDVHNGVRTEIETLREAGEFLARAMNETSGKIFKERDNIIELMKITRNELRVREPAPGSAGAAYLKRLQEGAEAEKARNLAEAQRAEAEIQREEAEIPVQFSPRQMQEAARENPEVTITRTQRHLYEGLYSLTGDLNRALLTEPPQDYWPRYMRGEKDVFANYLCAWVQKNPEAYVQNRQRDHFKPLSRRYIEQFEILRKKLFDTPGHEVSEYLETSPLGRIYALLSADDV